MNFKIKNEWKVIIVGTYIIVWKCIWYFCFWGKWIPKTKLNRNNSIILFNYYYYLHCLHLNLSIYLSTYLCREYLLYYSFAHFKTNEHIHVYSFAPIVHFISTVSLWNCWTIENNLMYENRMFLHIILKCSLSLFVCYCHFRSELSSNRKLVTFHNKWLLFKFSAIFSFSFHILCIKKSFLSFFSHSYHCPKKCQKMENVVFDVVPTMKTRKKKQKQNKPPMPFFDERHFI